VDTTGTPASFKANFSQLYGIFPKNASAGAGDVDYLARWTSANELGKGIVQDDGTALTVGGNSTINGKTIIKNSGITSQLELHKTGGSLIYFYDDAGTGIQSYLGDVTVSTTADTFRIFHQGSVAVDIDSSQNVDFKESIQIRQTSGTAPVAGQFLKATNAQGQTEWADIGAVTATSGSATQVAVFDGTDSIIGDAGFIYSGGQLGIGTTPDTELHVKGAGITLKLETTSTTGNNYLTFFDSVGQKGYVGYASGANENLTILNDETGEIHFWTTDSGNNTIKAVSITADQNVQINSGGLTVTSTEKGVQVPLWTTAQQTTNTSGWGSTQQGTIWYNTDTKQFMGWNQTSAIILG
jgi:hypothetical protein